MRVALDSNFMIYVEGLAEDPRNRVAQNLLKKISPGEVLIPLQAVLETVRWLIKRARQPLSLAAASATFWSTNYIPQATNFNVLTASMELMSQHHMQVFDCIIFAAAAEGGADILLSEDMQDGFTWRGVTVVNPFLPEPSPLLQRLIKK